MDALTKYQCPTCQTLYDTIEDATNCINSTEKPIIEVGKIVKTFERFGWYDGQKNWVINPLSNKNEILSENNKQLMSFYYVVTAIIFDGHKVKYCLETKAMSGEQGYRGGWTRPNGHYKFEEVKNPPKSVVEESKELIGNIHNRLL